MPQDMCVIRCETPADHTATELITREAFWNVYRPGCLEHFILHTFRDAPDFVPELDLVLEVDGRLIGHVMYVHAAIQTDAGGILPVMTFGPLSIHPDFQRRGYGRRLLDASLERARELGRARSASKAILPSMAAPVFCRLRTPAFAMAARPRGSRRPIFWCGSSDRVIWTA